MTANKDRPAGVETPPTKAERRQQQRSLRTKEKLLDAAIEAFADNGFKGTSTRDIAERAGVHHPLITYHFHSKEELWRAAAGRIFSNFTGKVAETRKDQRAATPRDRTINLIHTIVRFAAENPEMHKVIMQESGHANPRIEWLVDTWLRPMYRNAVPDLVSLQRDGIAPDGDVALLYALLRLSGSALMAIRIELQATLGLDLHDEDNIAALADLIVQVFLPGAVSVPEAAEQRRALADE